MTLSSPSGRAEALTCERMNEHALFFHHAVQNKDAAKENGDNSVLTDQCDGTL